MQAGPLKTLWGSSLIVLIRNAGTGMTLQLHPTQTPWPARPSALRAAIYVHQVYLHRAPGGLPPIGRHLGCRLASAAETSDGT